MDLSTINAVINNETEWIGREIQELRNKNDAKGSTESEYKKAGGKRMGQKKEGGTWKRRSNEVRTVIEEKKEGGISKRKLIDEDKVELMMGMKKAKTDNKKKDESLTKELAVAVNQPCQSQ